MRLTALVRASLSETTAGGGFDAILAGLSLILSGRRKRRIRDLLRK
jgi:hypothetical protein